MIRFTLIRSTPVGQIIFLGATYTSNKIKYYNFQQSMNVVWLYYCAIRAALMHFLSALITFRKKTGNT